MPVTSFVEHGWKITGFFHNPNIQPLAEYLRRREGAALCADKMQLPMIYDDQAWNLPVWLEKRLPDCQNQKRCEGCIEDRLEMTAKKAAQAGYPHFSTTLLYSRYQPHEFIKATGEKLAGIYKTHFLYQDFRGYWQQGIDLSKAWEIYRQPYCGCIFSEGERYSRKLARLTRQTEHAS